MAEPREQWLPAPGVALLIPGWQENYTGELPKGDPRPPPPPQTPPPPGADPRNAIYAGGAPSSSNYRGGREGTRGRAPGETQEELAQWSGAYEGEGGTPAQGRRRAQAHPCLPDFRGKYIICYIEGQDVPQPPPDRDIVIIRIIADGDQEFEGYYTRPPDGPKGMRSWRPSESHGQRECPRAGAAAGGCERAQELPFIFPRPAYPGIFPQAPWRPCRIE